MDLSSRAMISDCSANCACAFCRTKQYSSDSKHKHMYIAALTNPIKKANLLYIQERPYPRKIEICFLDSHFFIAKAYSNVETHVCCISPAIIIKFSHYYDAVGWVTGTHPTYTNLAPAIPKVLPELLRGN